MTCEYCGFSRPVPDAKARKKRMDKEERARRNAEQEALKRARKSKQEAQARKAAGVGRLIAAIGSLLPIIIVGIVLYSNGVFDSMFGRGRRSGPAGYGGSDRPGLLDGPTGERQYNRIAASLKKQNYDLVGTMEVHAAEPTARVVLNMAKGNCYALAVGTPRHLVSVTLQTIPKVVHHPRKNSDVLHVCPEDTGSFAAILTLDRPGNIAWGLYWRPFSATKPKNRITPKQLEARRKKRSRRRRKRTTTRHRYDEPPPPPPSTTRGHPQHEPAPQAAPPPRSKPKKKREDGLPSEDKYKLDDY